jgi:cytochrome c-type biogenesis protein CcsB
MAGVLIIVTAFSIGIATFIENDFGTIAAKALIYNALWFELIILFVFVNLSYNTVKIRPHKTGQWSVFLFHISFLIIILGAALTRFVGYEGIMSIREGATESSFLTEHTYLIVEDEDGKQLVKKKVLFSELTNDMVALEFVLNEKDYLLETYNFVSNSVEYIDDKNGGEPIVDIMLRNQGEFTRFTLERGQILNLKGILFGIDTELADVRLKLLDGSLMLSSSDTLEFFDMSTGIRTNLLPDSIYQVQLQKLYNKGDFKWVFNAYYPEAALVIGKSNKNKSGLNGIHFSVKDQKGESLIESRLLGTSGYQNPKLFELDGEIIKVVYGSERIQLPFALKLRDFQLTRYPASNSPSSYASEVTLYDNNLGIEEDHRIFMNNVLDYKGYRFFQSSYDKDELGTVLSVNHDFWGMLVTYFGYGLMILAMFFALFAKNSRFKMLMRKTAATSAVLIGLVLMPVLSNAQSSNPKVKDIPIEQIDNLSKLLVQGHSGRFQPFNSVSSQVVRKFSRKTGFNGLNTDQILLGMMMNPNYWMRQNLIKVSNDELKKLLGNDAPRAKFEDFFDNKGGYKLSRYVDEAYQKKPAQRGTFDKDVIKVDERLNVFYMAIRGEFLKIFPVPNRPDMSWMSPNGPFNAFVGRDSLFVTKVYDLYMQGLKTGLETGNYDDANLAISGIKQFQEKFSVAVENNEKKMNIEIFYNKVNIFDRLFASYGIFGFIMLVLLFIKVLIPKIRLKYGIGSMAVLILVSFVFHTIGLAARWYISGHAPWSNGYEATVFIGWSVILAGLVFYRNSPISLASTSVLASLIMYVAHLSWMNPEITNLVPVLKSYWLTIHVAIITASYGFLAMGAFMGFLILLFLIFQTKQNTNRVISKVNEITRINEMTLIVGLYMLTIGTFLGGIWANESWGRYWGWDPKETWAMVSILVYAFILHSRYIPGLNNIFTFNLLSLLGYSSILMTFFGVNFYLSGLHSYASGDPMPIPDFVYYTLFVILVVSSWAYYKYYRNWRNKIAD